MTVDKGLYLTGPQSDTVRRMVRVTSFQVPSTDLGEMISRFVLTEAPVVFGTGRLLLTFQNNFHEPQTFNSFKINEPGGFQKHCLRNRVRYSG